MFLEKVELFFEFTKNVIDHGMDHYLDMKLPKLSGYKILVISHSPMGRGSIKSLLMALA